MRYLSALGGICCQGFLPPQSYILGLFLQISYKILKCFFLTGTQLKHEFLHALATSKNTQYSIPVGQHRELMFVWLMAQVCSALLRAVCSERG